MGFFVRGLPPLNLWTEELSFTDLLMKSTYIIHKITRVTHLGFSLVKASFTSSYFSLFYASVKNVMLLIAGWSIICVAAELINHFICYVMPIIVNP